MDETARMLFLCLANLETLKANRSAGIVDGFLAALALGEADSRGRIARLPHIVPHESAQHLGGRNVIALCGFVKAVPKVMLDAKGHSGFFAHGEPSIKCNDIVPQMTVRLNEW